MPNYSGPLDLDEDPAFAEAARRVLLLQAAEDKTSAQAELDAWLAQDPAHRRAWDLARRSWELAGALQPLDPPEIANATASTATVRWLRRSALFAGAGVAACLLLLFSPALLLYLQADHMTTAGEIRHVNLPDGSKVQLDTRSAIAVDYGAGQRRVTLLSGQAFFDVKPDPSRAFRVEGDGLAVEVVGTAFNVSRVHGKGAITVDSGRVSVVFPETPRHGLQTLGPGDSLRLASDGNLSRTALPPNRRASWRRGRLMVENATVAEVVAQIRRYRPGLVLIADKALAQRRVTGAYDLTAPLRALRAVAGTHAGKVIEVTPYLAILTGSRPAAE